MRQIRDIDDLLRIDCNLQVICPACGRTSVFRTEEVLAYFRNRGLNTAWEVAGSYFRCSGMRSDGGCGHKGARLDGVGVTRQPVLPKPEPTEYDLKREARRRR